MSSCLKYAIACVCISPQQNVKFRWRWDCSYLGNLNEQCYGAIFGLIIFRTYPTNLRGIFVGKWLSTDRFSTDTDAKQPEGARLRCGILRSVYSAPCFILVYEFGEKGNSAHKAIRWPSENPTHVLLANIFWLSFACSMYPYGHPCRCGAAPAQALNYNSWLRLTRVEPVADPLTHHICDGITTWWLCKWHHAVRNKCGLGASVACGYYKWKCVQEQKI